VVREVSWVVGVQNSFEYFPLGAQREHTMQDRTPEFRRLLGELQASLPIPKQRSKSQRPRRSAGADGANDDDQLSKSTASAYMQDAYTIVSHHFILLHMMYRIYLFAFTNKFVFLYVTAQTYSVADESARTAETAIPQRGAQRHDICARSQFYNRHYRGQ
jgi:hypothetical protein